MRLSARFVIPLVAVLGLIAYGIVPLVDQLTLKWFVRDLDMRTGVLASTVADGLAPLVRSGSSGKIATLFGRMIQDERLYAVGFCDASGKLSHKTPTFPPEIKCPRIEDGEAEAATILHLPRGSVHVAFRPVLDDAEALGKLALVHDMSFVERRSGDTRRYVFYLFAVLAAIISSVTVLIAQISWKGWVAGIRSLIRGEGRVSPTSAARTSDLLPIAKDIRAMVRDLEAERRERDESQIDWSPKALKEILRRELAGDEILIVSNREPYIHNRREGKVEVQVPASGVVTALEPVMRACSGTWIAHGSGTADRETVDARDHVAVPPEAPSYRIRRVWLSKTEEKGYYYGFANEGLWPLCHIAHVRPVFRAEDWKQYVAVNKKFAETVVQEAKTSDPVVLVQDYHFALLPRLVKKALPEATIISFWHIPWPNPEAFGICPWRDEILDGMLGSNILGFHTRFHCNNFMDTVDRFIECRADRETSTISYGGKLTALNHYPVSIEWPVRWVKTQKSQRECVAHVREINGFPGDRKIGVGVDRLDYTKGILERFMAIERFLELNPDWVGRFTFVQIAAPTRTSIEQYQDFEAQVRALARRVNGRFGREGYDPICLKVEHHEPDQVYEYYRASDVCIVSSLHDGMNLVAKEFIASRDDERGVLILSQFTGASRELSEALIVNPYDIDQCARALQVALEMPVDEQRDRIRAMRGLIQEFNVYRWAGRMLIDASRIRKRSRFLGRFGETGLDREPGLIT